MGGQPKRALVRLFTPNSSPQQGARRITHLLRALELSAIRLDRRPSPNSVPFHDVYLVELEQERDKPVTNSAEDQRQWVAEIEAGLQRVRNVDGETSLVGIW